MAQCFMNRELSWLQFNLRVLKEAGDRTVPLLERLKFLSIYYSNMDEFFMVRMGSLMHREALMPSYLDQKTGWSTSTELKLAAQEVASQRETAAKVYKKILAELKEHNVEVVDFKHLSKMDENISKKVFSEIKPLLSPRIVDSGHPLPFLWNLSTTVMVHVEKNGATNLGIVSLDRIPEYRVFETDGKQRVIIISELIEHYSKNLFKGYNLKESCLVRVTRNADVFIDDFEKNETDGFKKSMEKLLRKRKRELPVRLQVRGKISGNFQELLGKTIGIKSQYVFQSPVPFCLNFGKALKLSAELKYSDRPPVRTVKLKKGQYFEYLEKHDLLLSYPYQSMMPFIDMLYEAADDPDVHSIKITLYRLASSSKVAVALAYAADKGKDVECLLELRARFDEQNNIDYSEMLENAGCKVYYGLPGYKVHSKVCLITRKTGEEIKYITQIGTGNYNEVTSEMYCDLSVITSDKQCGEDASRFFEALSLGMLPVGMTALKVAPYSFKAPLLEQLEREKQKGAEGYVRIKVNSLNDMDIMRKLIECSQAGVDVELYIRGICCLLPGIEGHTDHIKVYSVVGRYLEHSRIFAFGKGEEQRVYVGSGDLLNRNTQRRVEAFIEIKRPEIQEQVMEVLNAFSNDHEKCWQMNSDGTYSRVPAEEGTASQERLYRYFTEKTVEFVKEEQKKGLFAWLKSLFGKK